MDPRVLWLPRGDCDFERITQSWYGHPRVINNRRHWIVVFWARATRLLANGSTWEYNFCMAGRHIGSKWHAIQQTLGSSTYNEAGLVSKVKSQNLTTWPRPTYRFECFGPISLMNASLYILFTKQCLVL